jgi:hypothetical protein
MPVAQFASPSIPLTQCSKGFTARSAAATFRYDARYRIIPVARRALDAAEPVSRSHS